MAGALMQLVAIGAQDGWLTKPDGSEPPVTFFVASYKRHTNFAMESMEQSLSGNPNLGVSTLCRISRHGDLMGPTYVEATLAAGENYDASGNNVRLGFRLLKQVELRIGGQMIDRHSSMWMWLWTELTHTASQKAQLSRIAGSNTGNVPGGSRLYVPLQFSYCRNPGLAIPLIALQYHDVELAIDFEDASNLNVLTKIENVSVWVDYYFLDMEERRLLAQKQQTMLIETVQHHEDTTKLQDTAMTLTFNHPVKELVWVGTEDQTKNNGKLVSMSTEGAQIKLNGTERFKRRNATYFNYVQPYQHHTGFPSPGINVYSFALRPEEHQPTGTCNFSRIDNAQLTVKYLQDKPIEVFALSYNVLRITSGMGGLAYSN
jgi:hypothetical protein